MRKPRIVDPLRSEISHRKGHEGGPADKQEKGSRIRKPEDHRRFLNRNAVVIFHRARFRGIAPVPRFIIAVRSSLELCRGNAGTIRSTIPNRRRLRRPYNPGRAQPRERFTRRLSREEAPAFPHPVQASDAALLRDFQLQGRQGLIRPLQLLGATGQLRAPKKSTHGTTSSRA